MQLPQARVFEFYTLIKKNAVQVDERHFCMDFLNIIFQEAIPF
jgi:hypothetical protein